MPKARHDFANETIKELGTHPSDVSKAAVAFLATLRGSQTERRKTADVLYLFVESLKYEMEATVERPDGTFGLRSNWKDLSGHSISSFLDYWLPRKVMGPKDLRISAPKILRKWLKWCLEQRYFDGEAYEDFIEELPRTKARDLKRLERAEELLGRLHTPDPGSWLRKEPRRVTPIAQRVQQEAYEDGYMKVASLGDSTATLKTDDGRRFGPVLIGPELKALLKVGDVVNVGIGKFGKSWKVLESGNVYPEGVVF